MLSSAAVASPLAPLRAAPRSTRSCNPSSHAAVCSSQRRELLVAAPALVALLGLAAPAKAFLGIGEDRTPIYAAETGDLIKKVQNALATEGAGREAALTDVKTQTQAWVAKYRRDSDFQGRPSYGNTYTSVNALVGHINSFGPAAPVPKKRLERIQKELSDASKYLQRGR